MSGETVKTHLKHIYGKLGVNRTVRGHGQCQVRAVVRGLQLGVIRLPKPGEEL